MNDQPGHWLWAAVQGKTLQSMAWEILVGLGQDRLTKQDFQALKEAEMEAEFLSVLTVFKNRRGRMRG